MRGEDDTHAKIDAILVELESLGGVVTFCAAVVTTPEAPLLEGSLRRIGERIRHLSRQAHGLAHALRGQPSRDAPHAGSSS